MVKPHKRRAGIKEVADLADVSISTVSNVLNGTKNVSPALRDRVLNAVQELNYEANSLGRGLKTRRTNNLAVVVPMVTNVFFSDLLKSIQQSSHQLGLTVSIFDTGGEIDREYHIIQGLCTNWYDGILLSSCADTQDPASEPYFEYLHSINQDPSSPPIICLEAAITNYLDAVVMNDIGGIQVATEHVISLGRKNIAYIASPYQFCMGKNRRFGYEIALRNHGLPIIEDMIEEGDYSCRSGYDGMQRLLERNEKIDAVVCGNDQMAIGAIACLLERNIRIPEDIAVIGFNDNAQSSVVTPSLSTIHVPKDEIGAKAVELFSRRQNNREAARLLIQMEGNLVVRKSTDPSATPSWNLDW